MIELIVLYTAGMLVSSGMIIIWNFSFISVHFLGWMFKGKDIITVEDLADAIAEKNPNLSELLFCPICLGFWLSLLIAALMWYINSTSLWFIPICGFSWPLFIFLFYKHIEKS